MAHQQDRLQSTVAWRQKQIETLTAAVQKKNDRIDLRAAKPLTAATIFEG